MNSHTDTNQDELFELCKEVYEKTGWEDTDKFYAYIHNRIGEYMGIDVTDEPHEFIAPLYTSDYLLEKLRDRTFVIRLFAMSDEIVEGRYYQGDYCASYRMKWKDFNDGYYADTPLKALLKLTIALSEAGELK